MDDNKNVTAPYSEEHLRRVAEFQKNVLSQLPKNGTTIEKVPEKIIQSFSYAPVGTFKSGIYYPPEMDRDTYIRFVQEENLATQHAGYDEVSSSRVVFLDRAITLNLFHPLFLQVFNLFLRRYGEGEIVITKAMTPPSMENPSPHSIGMAVDVFVSTKEERNRVMNAAWLVGFPTIVQAGSTESEAHVHLDICPHEAFLYDGELYEGPWSL